MTDLVDARMPRDTDDAAFGHADRPDRAQRVALENDDPALARRSTLIEIGPTRDDRGLVAGGAGEDKAIVGAEDDVRLGVEVGQAADRRDGLLELARVPICSE